MKKFSNAFWFFAPVCILLTFEIYIFSETNFIIYIEDAFILGMWLAASIMEIGLDLARTWNRKFYDLGFQTGSSVERSRVRIEMKLEPEEEYLN